MTNLQEAMQRSIPSDIAAMLRYGGNSTLVVKYEDLRLAEAPQVSAHPPELGASEPGVAHASFKTHTVNLTEAALQGWINRRVAADGFHIQLTHAALAVLSLLEAAHE